MFFGTLTGQAIKDTYQGLLKLADSTTGITQNLQAIQDGLGNNTGMRIATNQLEAPNQTGIIPLSGRYYGSGLGSDSGQAWQTGIQGEILAYPFYDQGMNSYTAMTVHLNTATTVSDTLDAAFYTTQMINPNGLFPSSVILSGITIPTTGSTGQRTITFDSDLSFSGYGGGLFFLVFKFGGASNPNVRYKSTAGIPSGFNLVGVYGFANDLATTTPYTNYIRLNSTGAGRYQYFSGQTSFQNPFPTNLDTLQDTRAGMTGNAPGFLLHTKGY